MSPLRSASLFVVAIAALTLTGCLSPYMKHAANTPDPKPSNALVAGFNIRFDSQGQKSLLDAAADVAQNSMLADFGKQATPMLATVLSDNGFTAAYDGPRAGKLDAIQLQSNSSVAALTGTWRHPDSSHWTPDTVDALFTKPADVIGKIKVDGQKEYFAFTEVVIRDKGMFFKEPYVVVRTTIYDQDAKKVLDLQGIGEGESRFFVADRSPKNLETALQRGFESIKTVPATEL
ncbi:MAG: hypothetical protein ACJ790_21375 [Myxococcaceae bacterium]